jgi:apurinic endonuclease APN1
MESTINYSKWNVGSHMGFSKEILPTLQNTINMGMYSFQFFMGNPQSYTRQKIYELDINNCKKLLKKFPTSIFSHFPYIANLNGSTTSLAWNNNQDTDDKLRALIRNLEYELSVLANFSEYKSGVVIHPGSYPKRDIGLDTIAKTINNINFVDNSKLLLENCAGEGNKLCKDFKEIKRVIDGITVEKKQNIGVCIDTAHIHGSGIYDLSKCDEVDRLFYDFENIIGMEYFNLIHLNDSLVTLGSKKDRHECLCNGYIWGKNSDSLIYLLNKATENNISIVMETTPTDIFTICNLK